MNRREFLIGSAAALLTGAAARPAISQTGVPSQTSPVLRFAFDGPRVHVPDDFAGLSYESLQLASDRYFSAGNTPLVTYFRTLAPRGVLRIGGNSSEFCGWSPYLGGGGSPTQSPASGVFANQKGWTIQPSAMPALAGFLEATGWDLIYGLNLGTGTPNQAAQEAAAVSAACGKRLIAFQIGNEPDEYSHNGLRPATWTVDDYLANWSQFEQAIARSVPNSTFAGPDVAASVPWIERFAASARADVRLLSGHYYTGGPPANPRMDIPHLLANDLAVSPRILAASASSKLPFRVTETNSCWGGGKWGVSDTFASGLWAAGYMLRLMAAGVAGVNFHGGGSGPYTPIAGNLIRGFSARPIYYGTLYAGKLAGTELARGAPDGPDGAAAENVDVFCGFRRGEQRVAIVNRDPVQSYTITVDAGGRARSATVWRLAAPGVDAKDGVTLAGASVAADGSWRPATAESTLVVESTLSVDVPAASALLAFVR